jgi:hypothetical protein
MSCYGIHAATIVAKSGSGKWAKPAARQLAGLPQALGRTASRPGSRWSLDILQSERGAIPKGLHHSARPRRGCITQPYKGCARRATLGMCAQIPPQPCKSLFENSVWSPAFRRRGAETA